MKKLSNAILLGPAHPYRGGLADFNQILARTFNGEGIPCRLFTFTLQYPSFLFPGKSQFTDAPAPGDLDITRVLNSVDPLNWIRTGLRIRRERPDLLIVRYWLPQMAPALGTVCRIARTGGTRTVAIMDNVTPHENRPMDRMLTRYMTGSLDGFVYMSRGIREQLDAFDRRKPSVFSPHPMYTSYGNPVPRGQACRDLGLNPDDRYAMFFGYIRDYKGLDILLDAWALLKKRGALGGLKLIVAGEYYSGRERYAEQIERLGIGENLLMMDRFIAEDEVGKLFSACDLVVQPYRSATQSGVTQIAYWFGVPMIVTDVGGLRDIVPDGEVGYVTHPDAEAIADTIERYFREGVQERFRANIREYRKRFTWERMVDNFRTLFGEIEHAKGKN